MSEQEKIKTHTAIFLRNFLQDRDTGDNMVFEIVRKCGHLDGIVITDLWNRNSILTKAQTFACKRCSKRQCHGKVRHRTLKSAEKSAIKSWILHMDINSPNPLHAYKCDGCHNYHVGHKAFELERQVNEL